MERAPVSRRITALAAGAVAISAATLFARAASDAAWTEPAHYRLSYRVSFDELTIAPEATLALWIPRPPDTAVQTVLRSTTDTPWATKLATDPLGNRILHASGRGRPSSAFELVYEIERRPSKGEKATDAGTNAPEHYRTAKRLVPLDGVIREIAVTQSKGVVGDRAKARAFYDYVVQNMRYDKTGEGWGRGDAIWACANKRGNCTDFHSLFIGMARSQGIPARFRIGFPIASGDHGKVPGYHCWAEFHTEETGWLPIDSSEAKKTGEADRYFGALPNDRVLFSTGRDLTLIPPQQGPPLNFFITPYAEIDGSPVPADQITTEILFERLDSPAAG